MAPPVNKHHVRLAMQEGTQGRPWYAYKYKKKSSSDRSQPGAGSKRNNPDPEEGAPGEKSARSEPVTSAELPPLPTTGGSTTADHDMASESAHGDQAHGLDADAVRVPRSINDGGPVGSSGEAARGSFRFPDGTRVRQVEFLHTFDKIYKLRISSTSIESTFTSGNDSNYTRTKFPIHELPFGSAGFGCAEEEIDWVKTFTKAEVVKMKCDIYHTTACTSFQTNASTSSLGNHNLGLYAYSWHPQINKYRTGQMTNINWPKIFWGIHASEGPSAGELGAQVVRKDYDSRFEFINVHSSGNAWSKDMNAYNEDIFPAARFESNFVNASQNEGLYSSTELEIPEGKGVFHEITRNHDYSNHWHLSKLRNGTTQMITEKKNGLPVQANYGKLSDEAKSLDQAVMMPANRLIYNSLDTKFLENWTGRDFAQIPVVSIGLEPKYIAPLVDGGNPELVRSQMDLTVYVSYTLKLTWGNTYMNRRGGSLLVPDPLFGHWQLRTSNAENDYAILPSIRHSTLYGALQSMDKISLKPVEAANLLISPNSLPDTESDTVSAMDSQMERAIVKRSVADNKVTYNLRKRTYQVTKKGDDEILKKLPANKMQQSGHHIARRKLDAVDDAAKIGTPTGTKAGQTSQQSKSRPRRHIHEGMLMPPNIHTPPKTHRDDFTDDDEDKQPTTRSKILNDPHIL